MGTYDQSIADIALEQWLEDQEILKQAEYYTSMEFGQYVCEASSFDAEYGQTLAA